MRELVPSPYAIKTEVPPGRRRIYRKAESQSAPMLLAPSGEHSHSGFVPPASLPKKKPGTCRVDRASRAFTALDAARLGRHRAQVKNTAVSVSVPVLSAPSPLRLPEYICLPPWLDGLQRPGAFPELETVIPVLTCYSWLACFKNLAITSRPVATGATHASQLRRRKRIRVSALSC